MNKPDSAKTNEAWIAEHPDSPEALSSFAEKIRSLRVEILCDSDTSGAMSTEHYLLAIDALGTAERFMRIALYHRRRGD